MEAILGIRSSDPYNGTNEDDHTIWQELKNKLVEDKRKF